MNEYLNYQISDFQNESMELGNTNYPKKLKNNNTMPKSLYLFSVISKTIIILFLAGGCATTRVDHFRQFSEAGESYSRAIVLLSEEAAAAAIDADSEILLKDRDLLSEEERREIYQERTAALEELLDEIRLLRRHTILLRNYFTALERLADSEVPEMVVRRTSGIVSELEDMYSRMRQVAIGEVKAADFIGEGEELAVAHFKDRILSRELRENASLIERQLALQKAVLTALSVELEADLQVITKAKAYREVASPYIQNRRLPARWRKQRRQVLSTYVMLAAVDNAVIAADKMHESFIALTEKRIRVEDWPEIFAEIDQILDLVEIYEEYE